MYYYEKNGVMIEEKNYLSSRCRNRHHDQCKDLTCECPHHGVEAETELDEESAEELEARIERASRRRTQHITHDQLHLMRTAVWDIEASNLAGDMGIMLCSSIKVLSGKVLTHRIDESPDYNTHRWDDSWLAEQTRDELEKYMVVVVWNGIKYDLPFLNTRLIAAGLRPLNVSNICFVDMLWASRYRLRLHSNRLESLIDYLDTDVKKTPILGKLWIRAMTGDKHALDQVVKHNICDLERLEEVAEYLSNFVKLQFRLVK